MDLNGDGLVDLIVGERNGYVNYFRRLGDGTLTSEGRILLGGTTDLDVGNNSAPFVMDWNGDGLLDLVVGRESTSGGSLYLYLNSGTVEDYYFTTHTPVQVGSSSIAWSRSVPHFEDMNGDGLQDLLVGEDYGHTYYLQNEGAAGSPVFSSYQAITVNGSPFAWPSGQTDATVYVNDWNEDGILDIVQGNYVKNVHVFLGNATAAEDITAPVICGSTMLSVAANPVSGTLMYSASGDGGQLQMSIYSADGRLVDCWSHGESGGAVRDLSGLPAGAYSLVARSSSELVSRRIAVVR